jgi:tetratricopeptide (TPR) repeat protein
MPHFFHPQRSMNWSICLFAVLVMAGTGCNSLLPMRLRSAEAKKSVSPSQSSISQLGAALPAMQKGDERALAITTADQMAKSGYFEEAVELYRQAETLGPKELMLDAQLAPALAGLGKYPESLARYRRLIEANPKDASLRTNFAWTLMESGDLVSAESELRAAVAIDIAYQPAQVNLGIVLAKQKRYEESLAILGPAIGESAAQHNIGVIAIDQGDESLAIASLEKALQHRDASPASQQLLTAVKSPPPTDGIATGPASKRR